MNSYFRFSLQTLIIFFLTLILVACGGGESEGENTTSTTVAADDSGTVAAAGTVTINVSANDSADNGLDLTSIVQADAPGNGSIVINADGSIDYMHDGSSSAITTDSFSYTINDASGASSNSATVTITITNSAPVAADDSGTIAVGGTVTINVAANDSDADNGLDLTSLVQVGAPSNGSIVINTDGSINYTHDGSSAITDSFSYTINDASGASSNSATVTITITNSAPVAADDSGTVVAAGTVTINVAANDSDADNGLDLTSLVQVGAPSNGSIVINTDGSINYTHDGSSAITDSFSYTINDISGVSSNPATVTITIPPPATAASPSLAFTPTKVFRFTWSDVSDASFYRVLENTDGTSGFSQVSGDIAQGTESFDLIVPLHARVNARYILQSCNASGCIDATEVAVSDSLVSAIGYFKASNTQANDQFGIAVSLSSDGNTLAVGASSEDSNANNINGSQGNDLALDSGAVYIFSRNGSTWSQQAYVKASNTGANDRFGGAVSLSSDGNTLAVGATGEASNASGINGNQSDNSVTNPGAVYVFSRSGSTWSQQAYVKASNTEVRDSFGGAVSLSSDGNTLAVGAVFEDSDAVGINNNQNSNSATWSGAVYVFSRSGSTWSQQAYVKASNTESDDLFGGAVSLSSDGNTLAVGAASEDSNASGINGNEGDNSATSSGAVYVFSRSGSTWSQQAYVKASNSEAVDQFGSEVSLSSDGNTLAVGATGEDSNASGIDGNEVDNSESTSGAVYVFSRSGSTWSQQAYLKASNTEEFDTFGTAVSLSSDGNTLAVGASLEDSNASGINGNQNNNLELFSGTVYVFSRSGSTWSQQAYVKASNTDGSDQFGIAVSLSSNGSTLAVGAVGEDSNISGINGNQNDNSAGDSGAVYVY